MLAAMDGFKQLFSNRNPILGLARNLGLDLADRLEPVKGLFLTRALGLAGDLPPLARA
jgi:2-octaprenylphenol hydroxylase